MRYKLLLLFCCLLSVQISFSQNTAEFGKLRVGIRAGSSLANLLFVEAPNKFAGDCPAGEVNCMSNTSSDDYTFDYKSGVRNTRLGILAGVYVEKALNDRLTLELGLNYEQKGIRLKFEEHTVSTENGYRLEEWKYYKRDIRNDYLTLPLVAKYRFSPTSRFYVIGGIYMGLLVNSAGTAVDSATKHMKDSRQGGYEAYRKMYINQEAATKWTSAFDAGIVGGGGMAYPLTDLLTLHVEARLNAGVLKVDRYYNNRFEESGMPGYTSYRNTIISENYYRGLNSQARNINLSLSAGITKNF